MSQESSVLGKNGAFAERHPVVNAIIGLIILIITCIIGLRLIKSLFNIIINGILKLTEIASNLDAVVIVALITGLVSIIGVVISSIIAKIVDYRKSRQEYLTQKREKPYGEFVEMVYKIQQNAKKADTYSEEQMIEDLSKFLMESIMNDMRKDLGLKRVKKGNLLGFFINDIKIVLNGK